uniref:Mannosyltransferase n=1 Tax=Timema tahoe TaxID=61484 RepID=A0A7R9IM17_9NEOP|nr:unnamed protein product [Timema tahoe]
MENTGSRNAPFIVGVLKSHYLLFGKGFQTWEYSPEYALRSYTYLLVHMVPVWVYNHLLQPNRILLFYFCRCLLGLLCAFCEVYFYKYMCLLSIGAWYQRRYELAIFTTALSTYLSWPFAALLGVPIALDMLVRRKQFSKFFQWGAISTAVILVASLTAVSLEVTGGRKRASLEESRFILFQPSVLETVDDFIEMEDSRLLTMVHIYMHGRQSLNELEPESRLLPMVLIDSSYYNRFVVAPFNILYYNVFTSHGPNLYGTEPWTFYFINGFLNFNFVFVAALLTPVFLEERFLFPIYPMICLAGAITVDALQKLWFRFLVRRATKAAHYLSHTAPIMVSAILVCSLLGVSRISALYNGYHAPLDLFMELSNVTGDNKLPADQNINICVGKEWYRFPTSFFLPDNRQDSNLSLLINNYRELSANHVLTCSPVWPPSRSFARSHACQSGGSLNNKMLIITLSKRWQLQFVKSEFHGQLPQPYSKGLNATSVIPPHMNDMNKEEPSRYIDVAECHFLVDLDLDTETSWEPNYSRHYADWTVIKSVPFLDTARSHNFFRAFFIPFVSSDYCTYAPYNLLQSKHLKLGKHDPR